MKGESGHHKRYDLFMIYFDIIAMFCLGKDYLYQKRSDRLMDPYAYSHNSPLRPLQKIDGARSGALRLRSVLSRGYKILYNMSSEIRKQCAYNELS